MEGLALVQPFLLWDNGGKIKISQRQVASASAKEGLLVKQSNREARMASGPGIFGSLRTAQQAVAEGRYSHRTVPYDATAIAQLLPVWAALSSAE